MNEILKFTVEKIADILIDYGIIKHLPGKIKIIPKRINFKDSNWTSKQMLVIQNKSNTPLFGIYIIGIVNDGVVDNIEIESPKNNSKEFENEIGGIIWDHSILRLNGKDENGNDAFIIKISSISAGGEIKFILKSRNDLSIKLKVLSYINTPEQTLEQPSSFAVPIELPIPFNMTTMSMLLRKK